MQACKKPTDSIRDWMSIFIMNVSLYEQETGEQYFPDPTPEERAAAEAQEPKVVDSRLDNGNRSYNVYTEGRAQIINESLVDNADWHELDFALNKAERKRGKPTSILMSQFWERLIGLSEEIQKEHAQRKFLKKGAKDAEAAAIRKSVIAELHTLGVKGQTMQQLVPSRRGQE